MTIFSNKINRKIILAFMTILVFVSCTKETDDPPSSTTNYSNGVFIINEGAFMTGTGTITYMERNGSGVQQELYQNTNQLVPLGNIAQSMNVINGKGFIAVNNANKVEVVNLNSFQSTGTIEGLNQPRYIIQAKNVKAYISCWDNTISIIDVESYVHLGQIAVGTGPEKMIKTGEQVWVLNQGGLSVDSTISVIDVNTDQIIQTIPIAPQPTGIQKDKNGNIWVLCTGRNSWHTGAESTGHLICIDPNDYSTIKDLEFAGADQHPQKLAINASQDVLFYNHSGGIYKFEILSDSLETVPFVEYSAPLYGLGLDPSDDVIYSSDALDYTQSGWVYRYNASTGAMIDSLQAGIVPGEFYFSN